MRRECPKCGDLDILTERRPNGNSTCTQCGYKDSTKEFDKVPDFSNPEVKMEYKDCEDSMKSYISVSHTPMPAFSLNNRFIVESYKEDRALKATVQNGFAMVSQKVSLKGLKLLVDADICQNGQLTLRARKGDLVYIREAYLQSSPWAKAAFNSDVIEGDFMIVEAQHVEFVVPK